MNNMGVEEIFSILSVILDENTNGDDIYKDLSEFRIIIDEKLIPSIELIQYENKYLLIDKLKKVSNDVAFYLHNREIIQKVVIGIDSANKEQNLFIYKLYLKQIFKQEIKKDKSTLLKNTLSSVGNNYVIQNNIPTIIVNDKEKFRIKALNIADHDIELTLSQYINLLHYEMIENLNLNSLVHDFIVPGEIDNKYSLVLFPSIGDNKKKYFDTYGEIVDTLIIRGNRCFESKVKYYSNIKTIIVTGKINEENKIFIDQYAKNKNIKLYFKNSFKDALLEAFSIDYSGINNFCYLNIVRNLLAENAWYLSNEHHELLNSLKIVNEDLVFKTNNTEEILIKLKKQIQNKIDNIEKIYTEYNDNCNVLIKKLSTIQEKLEIKENSVLENGRLCINNHVEMEKVLIELIIKLIDVYQEFPENNCKEILRKYINLLKNIVNRYSCISNTQFQKNISEKYDSVFVNKFLIKYSTELHIDEEQLIEIVKNIDDNFTPKEKYLIALGENNQHKSRKYMIESAVEGCELAIEKLDKGSLTYCFSVVELKEMADRGIAFAAFELGKKIIKKTEDVTKFDFNEKDGLEYLIIAASKENLQAISYLANYWLEKYYKLKTNSHAENALYYFTLMKKTRKNDNSIYETIGYLLFELKRYQAAADYFKNSKSMESNYYLGLIYENGYGCAINEDKALSFYEEAMNSGHAEASVQYERLNAKIEARKKKETIDSTKDYSSYTYYSGSYYSSGW